MPFSPIRFSAYARDLSEAVYELSRERMPIQDIARYIKSDIPDADGLSMTYAPGGNQVFSIGDRSVEVGPMATNDQIKTAFMNPVMTENKMSITGATGLKAKFEAAKARKTALEARAEAALQTYNSSAEIAEGAVKSLEDDAAALQAEVAQFTNGGPE